MAITRKDSVPLPDAPGAQKSEKFKEIGLDPDDIGGRIRYVRGSRKQKAFAGAIGCSVNTLIRYEKGQTEVTATVLKRIGKEFGVNANWLLMGEGPVHRGSLGGQTASESTAAHEPIDISLFGKVTSRISLLYNEHGAVIRNPDFQLLAAEVYNSVIEAGPDENARDRMLDAVLRPVQRHLEGSLNWDD